MKFWLTQVWHKPYQCWSWKEMNNGVWEMALQKTHIWDCVDEPQVALLTMCLLLWPKVCREPRHNPCQPAFIKLPAIYPVQLAPNKPFIKTIFWDYSPSMAWIEAYFEWCRNQARSGPRLKNKSFTQWVNPSDPFWFLAKIQTYKLSMQLKILKKLESLCPSSSSNKTNSWAEPILL